AILFDRLGRVGYGVQAFAIAPHRVVGESVGFAGERIQQIPAPRVRAKVTVVSGQAAGEILSPGEVRALERPAAVAFGLEPGEGGVEAAAKGGLTQGDFTLRSGRRHRV